MVDGCEKNVRFEGYPSFMRQLVHDIVYGDPPGRLNNDKIELPYIIPVDHLIAMNKKDK